MKKYIPESFKKHYPNTRMIIDATEFAVERPSSLLSQSSIFSIYKNRNMVKVLIGILSSGAIFSCQIAMRAPYQTSRSQWIVGEAGAWK